MLTISNLDPRENRNQTKGPRDGNAWRSVVESISESIQMLFPLGLYVESKKRKRPEICNAWQHKVHHSLLNIDFCFVWQIRFQSSNEISFVWKGDIITYFSFMSLIFWCFISFSTKTGINQWRVYPWIQGFAFVFYHLFYIDFEANPWFTGNLFMIHSSRPQKGIEISGLVNVHWFHSTAGLFVSIFNLFLLLISS